MFCKPERICASEGAALDDLSPLPRSFPGAATFRRVLEQLDARRAQLA